MNIENIKTNESNKFIYQFTDKLNLKNPNKNMALANLSIYYTWKTLNLNITTINLEFLLQLGIVPLFCLMDRILFLIYKIILSTLLKNQETTADNPPVQIYVDKIKNRIVFKIKTGYKLELLSKETIQLLGSSKKDIDQNKDGENVPKLESVEVALINCNLVNNNYEQASKVLFTFVPNKQFGQLITITPHSPTMLKTTDAEFSFIEVWFTDKNNRSLEIGDNFNITLIIGTG